MPAIAGPVAGSLPRIGCSNRYGIAGAKVKKPGNDKIYEESPAGFLSPAFGIPEVRDRDKNPIAFGISSETIVDRSTVSIQSCINR